MGCGKSTTSDYVRLFLKYGGQVNDYAPNGTNLNTSPILAASCYRLESVKLLVEAGANVNFEDTLTKPPTTALYYASLYEEIEIIKYLLEHGADYKKLLFVGNHNRQDYIMDFLRRMDFSNDSKKNKTKQEVIEFLEKRGLKY
jgi:ankyrin repeat protein